MELLLKLAEVFALVAVAVSVGASIYDLWAKRRQRRNSALAEPAKRASIEVTIQGEHSVRYDISMEDAKRLMQGQSPQAVTRI